MPQSKAEDFKLGHYLAARSIPDSNQRLSILSESFLQGSRRAADVIITIT